MHGDEDDITIERRVAERLLEERVRELKDNQGEMRHDISGLKAQQVRMTADIAALPGKIKSEVTTALEEEREAQRKSGTTLWTRVIQLATLGVAIIGTCVAAFAHR